MIAKSRSTSSRVRAAVASSITRMSALRLSARAVFPRQHVHLPRQQLEVDAGKRLHPWKLLDDAPHPEDGLRDRGCLRSSGLRADGGHQNATPLRSNTLAYSVHSPVRMTPRT